MEEQGNGETSLNASWIEETQDGGSMRLPDPGTLRLLYNNCNGLQVNEYFKSQLRQKAQKKKEEYLNETKEITKVGGGLLEQ